MNKSEQEKVPSSRSEDKIRGERLRPSPRLERRLRRWVATTPERAGLGFRLWPRWAWAGAVAGVILFGAVFFRSIDHGNGGLPMVPAEEVTAAQLLLGDYLGLEDLLADMDLVVFVHEDEFIFYDWMVY